MTVCNAGYTLLISCILIGYTSCFNIHENVVFHKTNEVALNRARWLVTFVHDLRPYEQFISTISNDLDQTNEVMETLIQYYRKTNQTGYVDTIHSLHEEIAILNDTYGAVKGAFDDYRTVRSMNGRPKRSLLPVVGQLMSFMFGTVTDADIGHIERSVIDLARNQKKIIHNLEESMTLLNLSRVHISENRRAIMDLIKCYQRLDAEIWKIKELFEQHFASLEQFINLYFQYKLLLDEIKLKMQNAVVYLDNLRAELSMLSLNHLSPSTISPSNLRSLLLEIKDKLPATIRLPSDPITDIWYFYNTLTCTTYLDGDKILIVLSIPLLDFKEKFHVYKVYNFPLPLHNVAIDSVTGTGITAKYDTEAEGLMINNDHTKYALVSQEEYSSCNNRYMTYCDPKSAIYQTNLKHTCIISLFLKHEENIKRYCRSVVSLHSELPDAKYMHSGIWVVATHKTMKFTVVCRDSENKQGDVTVQAPLGVIRLNMTCRASNEYLSLPAYYEKRGQGQFKDSWESFLKLRNISRSSLWYNFSISFPNKTSIKLSDGLRELKRIPMPAFLNMMHDYDEVRVGNDSLSFWPYIIGILCIVTILIVMICYCNYKKRRAVLNCERNWLANCCNDESGVTRTARVIGSVTSEDEAVIHQPRRQEPSTPDEGAVALATLLGEGRGKVAQRT